VTRECTSHEGTAAVDVAGDDDRTTCHPHVVTGLAAAVASAVTGGAPVDGRGAVGEDAAAGLGVSGDGDDGYVAGTGDKDGIGYTRVVMLLVAP